MEFPAFDRRAFRLGLHKMFPKNGYIDLHAAAQWLGVTPKTLNKWCENSKVPVTAWRLVYVCSSGDLSLFSRKWHGWHINEDKISTGRKHYTSGHIESLEWFQITNARLIKQASDLTKEVNALPWEKRKVEEKIKKAEIEIKKTMKILKWKLLKEKKEKKKNMVATLSEILVG